MDIIDLPELDDRGDCAHKDVRSDPADPYNGICHDCGETGFPLVYEGQAIAIDEFVDGLWAYLIHRHGGVVPTALQPKDSVKAELRRRALALMQTPLDPEGEWEPRDEPEEPVSPEAAESWEALTEAPSTP